MFDAGMERQVGWGEAKMGTCESKTDIKACCVEGDKMESVQSSQQCCNNQWNDNLTLH